MKRRFLSFIFIYPLLLSCGEKGIEPSIGIKSSSLILSNTSEFKESVASKATGEQKFLVIPCVFRGEREFTDSDLKRIERAFFASDLSEESDEYYYSLSEYYRKSSLGKLSISGEITEVMHLPYTVKEVENDGNYFPGVPASYFLEHASDELLEEYDVDKDGYVDNAVLLYSSPTSSRDGHFWAWVHTFATDPDLSRPSLAHHMWVGLDAFSSEQYSIDAHTIIHESGHLFGLRDYYPSDNYYLALGGHSMMDYNISDHDPYSKMLLEWGDPIYYDFEGYKEITIDLPKFEGSNKALLYKRNWNHTVMDEYLLFEYYTPDDLNERDAKSKYENRPLGFNIAGIKIYHVDSRIAECLYDESSNKLLFSSYVSEIPDEAKEGTYYVIGASNSEQDSRTDASRNGRYKQIALIENKPYNKLQVGASADDDSLFKAGDSFLSSSSAYLLNGSWNDGSPINISFKVNSLAESYANITLTYLGD